MSHGTDDFDLELERELHRMLDPIVAGPIPLRHAPRRTGFLIKLLGSAGAAFAAKAVTGIAVAALAVGTAGAATEAVITKSFNPADWRNQITLEVRTIAGEHPQTGGSSGTSATPSAHQEPGTSLATATPDHSLPVQVPKVSPGLPAVTPPVALPTVTPPKLCGPLNNEISTGC
jgi:hypothetical protein